VMSSNIFLVFQAFLVCTVVAAETGSKSVIKTADWGYANTDWSELYPTCGSGKVQSPIDVQSCHSQSSVDRPVIKQSESELSFSSEKNNFAMKCQNVDTPCSEIRFANTTYKMLQLHAHSPSENLLNGESYPLEIHMVHASEVGHLAVLGIFFKLGKHNDEVASILTSAQTKENVTLDASKMFYEHAMLCNFQGSLTTPPCTEGVQWFSSWGVHEISHDQYFTFKELVGGVDTNRPVQPLNGRYVSCVH
jgi:carbonic anhydrase